MAKKNNSITKVGQKKIAWLIAGIIATIIILGSIFGSGTKEEKDITTVIQTEQTE